MPLAPRHVTLSEDDALLVEAVREFAQGVLLERDRAWDKDESSVVEVLPQLADMGLLGLLVPHKYGGMGCSYRAYAAILHELACCSPSTCVTVSVHNMVGTIIRQGRDLSDIVEDLITRAQSEANLIRVVEVPVRLRAHVAQVLEVWPPGEAAGVTVSGSAPVAIGDPARVRQIVRNLITNAVRYGKAPIEIVVGGTDQAAWLRVYDAGLGVPEAESERIFDPYHGVGEARPQASLGLGLAISRELARLMGGDLRYEREGDRTKFELSLRVATAPPP